MRIAYPRNSVAAICCVLTVLTAPLLRAESTNATVPMAVNSRGALVANTWSDLHSLAAMGRTIAANPPSSGEPGVQFAYVSKSSAAVSAYTRWGYNAWIAAFDQWLYSGGSVVVQFDGPTSLEAGFFPRIHIDPTGTAYLGGYDWVDATLPVSQLHLVKDFAPMIGIFGNTPDGSVMSETVRDQSSQSGGETYWPTMAVSEFGGQTVFYMCAWEIISPEGALKVFRKSSWSSANPDNSWQLVFTDTSHSATGDIACDPSSTKVACAWTKPIRPGSDSLNCDVWMAESPTGLSGSWTRTNVSNYSGAGHRARYEVACLFDTQSKFHIVWNGSKTDGVNFGSRSCRLFHWSQWSTITSTVYWAEWDPNRADCWGGSRVMNVGHLSIAECDGRLYTTFSCFNDAQLSGHVDDCVSTAPADRAANGEYYVSVSSDLQGTSWDRPRNLSNSYTPACDSATCADDRWGSLALYPIDDAAFPGVESWPEDATYDPSGNYAGTQYLQFAYVTDRYPGQTRYEPKQGPFTSNDIRWIRLACVGQGPMLTDQDGDGAPDGHDNCPLTPNANQDDGDNNGVGDACEATAEPTSTGSNVEVSPSAGVTLTFSQVTVEGSTQSTGSSTGPQPPNGYAIAPIGNPVYYEINSNVVFTGTVQVCIAYDPGQLSRPEQELRLFHMSGEPLMWQDITTSVDTAANMVCGMTTHFSPFVLAEPVPAGCCSGTTGNVNDGVSEIPDLSDLSLLIAYLTTTPKPTLLCGPEANVNGSGVNPDISDLSLLIAYLTVTPKPALPACP